MDTSNLKFIAIISLLLTIGIFSFAFLTGTVFQNRQVSNLEHALNDINTRIIDTENVFLLAEINNDSCIYLEAQLMALNEDLKDAATRAIAMEADLKTNTREYQNLKTSLIATRIRYWLLAEKTKKICNPNMTTILYFYSTETICKDCNNQGLIIEHINQKMNQSLIISVVDLDEDLETMNILKKTYGITEAPVVVIDNEVVFKGLTPQKEFLEYFCLKFGNDSEMCLV